MVVDGVWLLMLWGRATLRCARFPAPNGKWKLMPEDEDDEAKRPGRERPTYQVQYLELDSQGA